MGGLSRDWRVRGAGTSLGMREATRGLGRLGIREFRVPRPFLLRVSSEKASFAKQARGHSIHVHFARVSGSRLPSLSRFGRRPPYC